MPDLARSLAFYADRLGFTVTSPGPGRAELAADPDGPALLGLLEDRTAAPAPAGVEFDGFADHGVSDALYLADPDGNGLEFYADRPRGTWPREAGGELAMVTRALDLRKLVAEGTGHTGSPLRAARWGHLHLSVTDLERSEAFYRRTLGLETTQRSFPGARFLAADGYHHHIGLNTWGGSFQARPPHALGLAGAVFRRAGVTTGIELADPDQIMLRLEPDA